ncbi:hypothetical protein QBC46DRAFT_435756 [Diplogelasinospora grovesii]|uniref:DUF676 domain-containing protein n=1 Tax=Diplogelasinospora grovesii TaxID=303347 RepID=A0AAN6NFX7_9PEZI|nr:hypothetical protein QBC46DRAFT_435756 [Diplogelasinospora grovesii]
MSETPKLSPGGTSLRIPEFSGPSSGAGRGSVYPQWDSFDPRTSSSQSLVPTFAEREQRRTLLVIYIHGFMGQDSSFRSFPAHVHNFLKESLAETHVVHSKIYPRYKTYRAIVVARDNFSKWLQPHESPETDVILIGHSMGGLLAADIALLPSQAPPGESPFRHRILGTISLDAPLLGLHPGIIVSGIASLFRPSPSPKAESESDYLAAGSTATAPPSPDPSVYSEVSPPSGVSSPSGMSSLSAFGSPAPDPFFNPAFPNDVKFVDRGWFKNITHFANKHRQENLVEAAANHVMSHLEFGACLADYPALHSRYNRLRKLEDVDDLNQPADGTRAVRVRFVNYYTISTGRLKKPKPRSPSPFLKPIDSRQESETRYSSDVESRASTPRISIEDHGERGRPMALQEIEPIPEPEEPEDPPEELPEEPESEKFEMAVADQENNTPTADDTIEEPELEGLPAIPHLPEAPQLPDLDSITDKQARKQTEKEAKQAQKDYQQAVKKREKTIKERQKAIEKLRRKAAKDAEKKEKEKQKQLAQEEKAVQRERAETLKQAEQYQKEQQKQEMEQQGKEGKEEKQEKKKERKFCMLPKKANGVKDPTWVQVFMEGVDEVGAHTGLFFPGPHYEKLIGDVGSMIVSWVHEDASKRAIMGLD